MTHSGGCHCGRVRFEVDAPAEIDAHLCNCSICSKTAYLHLVVPRDRFRLLSGENDLATYTFNTGVAKHYFCSICGIYTHHQRRSNPQEYGVNVACLDGVSPFDFPEVIVNDGVNHSSDAGSGVTAPPVSGVLRFIRD